jgi:hypothetical protein
MGDVVGKERVGRFNARRWRGQKCLSCTAGLVEDGSAEGAELGGYDRSGVRLNGDKEWGEYCAWWRLELKIRHAASR